MAAIVALPSLWYKMVAIVAIPSLWYKMVAIVAIPSLWYKMVAIVALPSLWYKMAAIANGPAAPHRKVGRCVSSRRRNGLMVRRALSRCVLISPASLLTSNILA